jgi:hypothetical protein
MMSQKRRMTQKRWAMVQDELDEVLQRHAMSREAKLAMLGALVEHWIMQEEDHFRPVMVEIFVNILRGHLGVPETTGA